MEDEWDEGTPLHEFQLQKRVGYGSLRDRSPSMNIPSHLKEAGDEDLDESRRGTSLPQAFYTREKMLR